MNNFFEDRFEEIEIGSGVEIIFNSGRKHENGKVVENSSKQLHIIDEVSDDRVIPYDGIKSVQVFGNK